MAHFVEHTDGCPGCGYWQCLGDCGESGDFVPDTVAMMKTSIINNSISDVTQACSICRLCSSDCRCHVVLVERDVIFGDTIWEEPCGDAMDCNGWTCECSTRC